MLLLTLLPPYHLRQYRYTQIFYCEPAQSESYKTLKINGSIRVCKEFVCPYTSCSDCCIVLCWSWSVVVVVVVECCCGILTKLLSLYQIIPYQLALILVLTFAPSVHLCTLHPDLCTLCLHVVLSFYQRAQVLHLHTWWWSLPATCAGGVFPSAIGANTPCTRGGVTHCNFHPLAYILHLCSSNLHCVVVYIRIYHHTTVSLVLPMGANTLAATF